MQKILFLLLLVPSIFYAQRVQLSSIPGQDSGMDINDMLKQIMAPYYHEITNLNNSRRDKEIEQQLWQDFKTNIDNFDRVNRYLYGYESPFRSLTNDVSDPSILTMEVQRNAARGEYKIMVQQLAQPDAFSSAPVLFSKDLPAGKFTLGNAKTNITVDFKGGNIQDLGKVIRQNTKDLLTTEMIHTSTEEKTLLVRGKDEGQEAKINFDGDLAPLLESKLLTMGDHKEYLFSWQENTKKTIISNSSINKEIKLLIESNTTLSLEAVLSDIILPENTNSTTSLESLPSSNIGSVSTEIITLPGAVPILKTVAPLTKNTNAPKQNIILCFDNGIKEEIVLNTDKYNISLSNYIGKTLDNITITAEKKAAELSDIKIISIPEEQLQPYKVITKAQDAIMTLDGVEVRRSKNTIGDLLPGVTFNLLNDSAGKNIIVKIFPDINLIKETIINWVMSYNSIMEEIFTFTTIPFNRIGRLKPLHQREKDEEDLKEGTFYGNSSLMNYKDRLRRLVGTSYGYDPNQISLLDQIGIYVKRQNSTATDPEALRKGTLSLDVTELEKVLDQNFDAVFNLFARDTDSDLVADIGVSIAATEVDEMMIGGNGYLTRLSTDNANKMKDLNNKIAKKEEQVEKTERKERQALLQMSQAVAASKAQSESLKNRFN